MQFLRVLQNTVYNIIDTTCTPDLKSNAYRNCDISFFLSHKIVQWVFMLS